MLSIRLFTEVSNYSFDFECIRHDMPEGWARGYINCMCHIDFLQYKK